MSFKSCAREHIGRFIRAARKLNRDFFEGHAWVNIFAEWLRCRGVPERIIKARIGPIGPPHVIAIMMAVAISYGIKYLIGKFL